MVGNGNTYSLAPMACQYFKIIRSVWNVKPTVQVFRFRGLGDISPEFSILGRIPGRLGSVNGNMDRSSPRSVQLACCGSTKSLRTKGSRINAVNWLLDIVIGVIYS